MPLETKQKKLESKPYLTSRPPIVAVLGHVDHGKTSLLDVIRKSNLASQEYGGITQKIGAYQIEYKGEKITFIDTPGHAAFAKMRAYGASVTDLVILVVAADEGVKPQTKECLTHIREAKVPFLVAINKIDLPGASSSMVKSQLAQNNVLVEGYGGDVVCVEVSAKEKKGIDELLEMVLLLGKMQDLKADPKGELEGVVIDSRLDSKKGPLATVLVKNGTLRIGDKIFAAEIEGKVRAMMDENGKRVLTAEPSKPVEVLGFKGVVPVGAKVKRGEVKKKIPSDQFLKEKKPSKEEEGQQPKIKIILKAETRGVLEAIKTNLPAETEIIFDEVGEVNESDVLLASSTQAVIVAFNVRVPSSVQKLAESEKVRIKTYRLIYEFLEEMERKVLKMLDPTIDEEILGEAEIIAEFNMKGKHIAGCQIKKGKINKRYPLHLKREGKIIGDTRIASFQKERIEIEEGKAGDEVGIVFTHNLDFKKGDVIISYNKKE